MLSKGAGVAYLPLCRFHRSGLRQFLHLARSILLLLLFRSPWSALRPKNWDLFPSILERWTGHSVSEDPHVW